MDLDAYTELTGLDVSDSQRAFVAANITKARVALESALGYPLTTDQENLYTERGKAQSDYWCDTDEDLLDPDEEPSAKYRLFHLSSIYGSASQPVFVDPCKSITKVKLVHGDVTVHTFEVGEYSFQGRLLILRGIFPHCFCEHVQVAVDADWIGLTEVDGENLPGDLRCLWADQAAHLSDKTRLVRSESRGTRSYTKAVESAPIESSPILSKYAGPHGTAGRLPL